MESSRLANTQVTKGTLSYAFKWLKIYVVRGACAVPNGLLHENSQIKAKKKVLNGPICYIKICFS